MISSKQDLIEYLEADRINLGMPRKVPLFGKEIWKYQISLRKYEYYLNCGGSKIAKCFWRSLHHHYGIKLGFTIPPNTFGKGLNIHHYGLIVVNDYARIGDNCNIQQGVNIGRNYGQYDVPTIGDNVYIGPGAIIFGKIKIADGCAIGAGAIVNRSFFNENMTIVGVPAKEIGKRKPGLQ